MPDRSDFSGIAHRGLSLMNPLPDAAVGEVLDALDLPPGATALDLCCGKGELLVRLAARWPDLRAVGVDTDHDLIEAARRAAAERAPGAALEFNAADAADAVDEVVSVDLAVAVGAGWDRDYGATLGALAGLAHPGGGLVLFGEGYWRRQPTQEYLEALGAEGDELADWEGTIAAAAGEGLVLRHAVASTVEDWDRYESRWAANGEAYVEAHPGEPGADELLAWLQAGRERYLRRGGRETLGFGLFLFERE